MIVSTIKSNEYDTYSAYYIHLVPEGELLDLFKEQGRTTLKYFKEIPMSKWNYAYAQGKWTILEILQHMIDVERILAYRTLRIAREDKTAIPGFEVDDYVIAAKSSRRKPEVILKEYELLKNANQFFFASLEDEMLKRSGLANDQIVSCRALICKLIGHEIHHIKVIKERYLS